jgi:hypothetical protein
MPYEIIPFETGYRVCKVDEPSMCFSNRPLSKRQATKQMKAIIISELQGGAGKPDVFVEQLHEVGLTPAQYLSIARKVAKREGYDPKVLTIATDGTHKLTYDSPEGIKHFGRVGYGDYIIYCWLERNNEIPKGFADIKRHRFRSSHEVISRIHNLGKYSPNELAINILW